METEWYEHSTPWIIAVAVCVTIVLVQSIWVDAFAIPRGVEIRKAGDAIVIELQPDAKAVVFVGDKHYRIPMEVPE